MKKALFMLFIFVNFINAIVAQELVNGQKRWSITDKLTIQDFKFSPPVSSQEIAYSQFIIAHKINAFDAMKRNLNQRVDNIFHGRGSWIDTLNIENIEEALGFQQLQFDLAEVQARKFRKQLLQNKGKILGGFEIVNQISDDIMAQFAEIRANMVTETDYGRNEKAVKLWEERIATELEELDQFRYENTKRIKL